MKYITLGLSIVGLAIGLMSIGPAPKPQPKPAYEPPPGGYVESPYTDADVEKSVMKFEIKEKEEW